MSVFLRRTTGLCILAAAVSLPCATGAANATSSTTFIAIEGTGRQAHVALYHLGTKTPFATIQGTHHQFESPEAVVLDAARNLLYVSDCAAPPPNGFDPYAGLNVFNASTLQRVGLLSLKTDNFPACGPLRLDSAGNLYTFSGQSVYELPQGQSSGTAILSLPLSHVAPAGLAVGSDGTFYVGYGGGPTGGSVEVYAPGSQTPSRTITSGFNGRVEQLAIGLDGTLYVLGQLNASVGTPGHPNQCHPAYVAVYPAGASAPSRTTKPFSGSEVTVSLALSSAGDVYVSTVQAGQYCDANSQDLFGTGRVVEFPAAGGTHVIFQRRPFEGDLLLAPSGSPA